MQQPQSEGTAKDIRGVSIVHWNPHRPLIPGRIGSRLPIRRPINNFGDLLGPEIVSRLVTSNTAESRAGARLLTVGSILHFARDGDTVWGTGVNGKISDEQHNFSVLDVRAVRGPRTREFLRDRGIDVPEVYGDPGLLVGALWSRGELARGYSARDVTVVPNLNEIGSYGRDARILDPRVSLREALGRIAASSFVTGSSLHGIVIAEALGIPARLIRSGVEHELKYDDYYSGTGRGDFEPVDSIVDAIKAGGEKPLDWDSSALLSAFPRDLWER